MAPRKHSIVLASRGEDNLRRFYLDLDGKEVRIGNACLFIGNKDCSGRYAWMPSIWLEKEAEYGSHVEETDETCGSRMTIIIS